MEKKKEKWVEDINRHFPKEDIQMANRHEKILNIISYYRNASQNYSVLLPHMFGKAIIKETSINNMLERVWRKRNPSTLLVEL